MRYFERAGVAWRVKPELKRMVEFKQMNLIREWPPMRFDIVFLRNVLIYFDQETKRQILDCVRRVLPNDGFLILGGSEMLSGVHDGFTTERSGRATFHRPR